MTYFFTTKKIMQVFLLAVMLNLFQHLLRDEIPKQVRNDTIASLLAIVLDVCTRALYDCAMQIAIKDIIVKKRIRTDAKDITELAQSLERYGLLNPVIVTQNYKLIAGERRILAAKSLGWTHIEASIISNADAVKLLEIELEENTERKAFSKEEQIEGEELLKKLQNPPLANKFCSALANLCTNFLDTFSIVPGKEKESAQKCANTAWCAPIGLVLIITTSVLGKARYISSILHSLLDLVGFLLVVLGAFCFWRYLRYKDKSRA